LAEAVQEERNMAGQEPTGAGAPTAFSKSRNGPAATAILACLALICGSIGAGEASAQEAAAPLAQPAYADLVDLADQASIVPIVTITGQAAVEPERSPGLLPGMVRLYLEADTETLLSGRGGMGESVAYLADANLAGNGKAPKLKKARMILFADPVRGRIDQLQLVERDSQLPATPSTEARVRAILAELVSPDAPPRVTGIRDVLSVPGNLAGEWETQIFLATENRAPASITILRRSGQQPQWGVSWNELVAHSLTPPGRDSLEWYRLACFLPAELPASGMLGSDPAAGRQAATDYALVLRGLGPCTRTRS
jgi:hypothetical protein